MRRRVKRIAHPGVQNSLIFLVPLALLNPRSVRGVELSFDGHNDTTSRVFCAIVFEPASAMLRMLSSHCSRLLWLAVKFSHQHLEDTNVYGESQCRYNLWVCANSGKLRLVTWRMWLRGT